MYVVNNDEFQWPNMTSEELLRCQTLDRLVVIDRPRDRVRYREWARGGSTAGKASLVLEGAAETWDGSGVCVYAIWTFAKGQDSIVVSRPRCLSSGEGPPYPVGYVSFLEKGTQWPIDDVPEQPCFSVGAAPGDTKAPAGLKK